MTRDGGGGKGGARIKKDRTLPLGEAAAQEKVWLPVVGRRPLDGLIWGGARTVIRFQLNGQEVLVAASRETSLLEVLRDHLHLVGTKRACQEGLCGSCTVLINGRAKTSCNLPVGRVTGSCVTTIEGLGHHLSPHPIQRAFAEAGAVQCGYCTPGMVMAAKTLLDGNPEPTREDIVRALRGHLCRCTGYVKIVEAVRLAARYLREGTPGRLFLADPLYLKKATGEAKYTDDLRLPGLLHARVLHSPVPHGEILKLDLSSALLQPGVRGIFARGDIPGKRYVGRRIKDQPILAEGRTRYLGEPIALVVAETPAAAERALEAIALEIKPLEPLKDPKEALAPGAPLLHPNGNVCWERYVRRGNIEEGFRRSVAVVEETYRTSFNEHLYLETDSALAHWDEEGRLVVSLATQEIHEIQRVVAEALSLPLEKVRVIQTATGGSFGGRKICPFPVLVALASYHLRAPVRLTYTRRETFLDSTKRHPFVMRYRLGADGAGRLQALEVEIGGDAGAYASYSPPVLERALAHAASCYEVPHVFLHGRMVYTNNPVTGAMRGFGTPQVTFAMECQMDRLAGALRLDPMELRLRNVLRPGRVTITGQRLAEDVQAPSVLAAAAHALSEARERARRARAPEPPWRRGVGVGCHWFGLGTTRPRDFSEVRVSLEADGAVEVGAGVADMGQGSTATLRTIAAETLGVPMERVRVIHNDTARCANSGPSNASRQTYFSGNALVDGLGKLVKALTPLAAQLLESPAERVRWERGEFFSPGDPDHRVPLERLAALASREGKLPTALGRFEADTVLMDPETGEGRPHPLYTSGAHVAEVEVNLQTGQVRLLRITSIHDIGRVVDRTRVEGQIEGSVAMGIGFALLERFVPGKTERLRDYPVPRVRDIPEIRSVLVEVPDRSVPFGAKGIGESGLLSVAPAILNAIRDATSVSLTALPARKDEVRRALRESSAR